MFTITPSPTSATICCVRGPIAAAYTCTGCSGCQSSFTSAPIHVTVSPRVSALITTIASRSVRSVAGAPPTLLGPLMPVPRPSTIRPPDCSWIVAAAIARPTGVRVAKCVTPVPTRMRSVAAAQRAMPTNGSRLRAAWSAHVM